MTFDKLPVPVQALLSERWEQEMRESFEAIEHEVLQAFLDQPEVKAAWQEYRETWFRQELNSCDSECYFEEWLLEQGLTDEE